MEPVEVVCGRYGDGELFGPYAGARDGNVIAYDHDLPPSFEPWPGRTRTERTFVLLDLGISFANVCWVRWQQPDRLVDRSEEGSDTWYVDLITVRQLDGRYEFRDLYLDVLIPTGARPYRMLDLDEFGDALASGVLSPDDAVDGLRRWQRFLDQYLHPRRAPSTSWFDFPPASIASVAALPPFSAASG